MTLHEFATHLTTQPWGLSYVRNVLSQYSGRTTSIFIDNYISGTFTWNITPEGWDFWNRIRCNTTIYDANNTDTLADLIAILPPYFPNNPELFI